jgi:hypothetical protein
VLLPWRSAAYRGVGVYFPIAAKLPEFEEFFTTTKTACAIN